MSTFEGESTELDTDIGDDGDLPADQLLEGDAEGVELGTEELGDLDDDLP